MQRHREFSRQFDLHLPWPCPLGDRCGPGAQAGPIEVSAEDRVRGFKQALAGEHVTALRYPTIPTDFAGFVSPRRQPEVGSDG